MIALSLADNLLFDSPAIPNAAYVYCLPQEIRREIYTHLLFNDLMALAHTSRIMRTDFQSFMSSRIASQLQWFFGSHYQQLLDALDDHDGCLTGLFVASVFNTPIATEDITTRTMPSSIDIMVGRSACRLLKKLLDVACNVNSTDLPKWQPYGNECFCGMTWAMQVCAIQLS